MGLADLVENDMKLSLNLFGLGVVIVKGTAHLGRGPNLLEPRGPPLRPIIVHLEIQSQKQSSLNYLQSLQ